MKTRFVHFNFFWENHWSWNEVKLNYTRLKKVQRGWKQTRQFKGNRTIQENAESIEFKICFFTNFFYRRTNR